MVEKTAERQNEFKDFPERTPLGKAALKYLEAREEVEKKKEVLEKVKPKLVDEFIKAKRVSISVDGENVSYAHSEKDLIKVTRTEGR